MFKLCWKAKEGRALLEYPAIHQSACHNVNMGLLTSFTSNVKNTNYTADHCQIWCDMQVLSMQFVKSTVH